MESSPSATLTFPLEAIKSHLYSAFGKVCKETDAEGRGGNEIDDLNADGVHESLISDKTAVWYLLNYLQLIEYQRLI